jgi:hypothetical protein
MDTPSESATQKKFHDVGEDWLAKAEAAQPMGQLVKPDQLAGLAVYLLSPESGVMTGALLDYDRAWRGLILSSGIAYPDCWGTAARHQSLGLACYRSRRCCRDCD